MCVFQANGVISCPPATTKGGLSQCGNALFDCAAVAGVWEHDPAYGNFDIIFGPFLTDSAIPCPPCACDTTNFYLFFGLKKNCMDRIVEGGVLPVLTQSTATQ